MTPQYGALYKIANGPVSVYYTHSEAVIPQTQIDASGGTVQPIQATGWDAGAKIDFLGDTLDVSGTPDYYTTVETNTAIANSAADVAAGLPSNATYGFYFYGNAQRVKGIQGTLDWNITKNNQLKFGINEFYEAAYIAPNSNPQIIGLPLAALPATNYTLVDRYEFTSGSLKGLFLGGSVLHNSEAILGGGNFNYINFYTEGYTIWSPFVGYTFNAYGHKMKAKILVDNAGNEAYRIADGYPCSSRTIVFSPRAKF